MNKVLPLLIFTFLSFNAYSFETGSKCQISSLILPSENVYVSKQNISCNDEFVTIEYVINNDSRKKLYLPIKIQCNMLSEDATFSKVPPVSGFEIECENELLEYEVYDADKKIDLYSFLADGYELSNGAWNYKLDYCFSVELEKKESKTIKVSCKNLRAHGNAGFDYLFYEVTLHGNENGKSVDVSGTFAPKHDSDLYLCGLNLYGSESADDDERHHRQIIDYEFLIHKKTGEDLSWNFDIKSYCSTMHRETLRVCLREFNLDSDFSWYGVSYNEDGNPFFRTYRNKDERGENGDLSKGHLNEKILFFLTKNQLALLRNCFYALHGYEFKNPKVKEYFQNFPWYKIDPDFSESSLNKTEKENIEIIKNVEKSNSKESSFKMNGFNNACYNF